MLVIWHGYLEWLAYALLACFSLEHWYVTPSRHRRLLHKAFLPASRTSPLYHVIRHSKPASIDVYSFFQQHRQSQTPHLPLRLLAREERLENADDLVQRGQVRPQLLEDLVEVVAELGVEVLAVGAGAHGGAEDGLDHEAVVRLERDAVGAAEGVRQLGRGVGEVLAERDAGELEAAAMRLVYAVGSTAKGFGWGT